jgi:hypothetical protein
MTLGPTREGWAKKSSRFFPRIAAVHGKPWPAANRKADWHVGTFSIIVTMRAWSSERVMGASSWRSTFPRVYSESLLAIMPRHASGASPLEPGNAIASRSGLDQTRARACPFKVMRSPPELHTCAAMVIPPILGMNCSSCSQFLSDCGDSAARSVTPHAPIVLSNSWSEVEPAKRHRRCTPSLELASKPRRT